MRMEVPGLIAKIALLRQHVAHRTVFERWQLAFVESRVDRVEHLGLRFPRQGQLGSRDGDGEVCSHGRRIEADWRSILRFQNSGSPNPAVHERSTIHTK